MPAARKRENRESHFYNVGEQGRKTGIRLEDKGVRDEFGMEPVSGIFSSPEKSPPKRSSSSRRTGGTVTESESMDIQESSIPDLTPGHLLRNSRPNLPPPRSRSPMKTALGSSPRRQSSMAPRALSVNRSDSPDRAASHSMVSRRLDFDQEDSSLQETPALSGSGARRGKSRRDVYDVEQSPTHTHTVVMEESVVQEEATVNEDSPMVNGIMEESFAGIIGEDYTAEAIDLDASVVEEESEVVAEPIKQPAKRGRKRKSDVDESATGEVAAAPQRKKRGTAAAQSYSTDSFEKSVQPPIPKPRGRPARAKRTSEITEEEPSTVLEAPTDDSLHVEESPVAAPAPTKGRGRRPKVQVDASADISEQIQKPAASAATKSRGRRPKNQVAHSDDSPEQTEEAPVPTATKHRGEVAKSQTSKAVTGKENAEELVFKKPKNPTISKAKTDEKLTNSQRLASGKLVNNRGIPLSKEEIDRQSITTTGSRFGRGRTLSVFRELGPEEYGRVGRTGRHHLPPVNFWANERAEYERDGSLKAILKDETKENEPIKKKSSGRQKGKKRAAATIEEDEEELEEWETEDGIIEGDHRDFDPVTETTSDEQLTSTLAWADKAIVTREVPSLQFKFVKLDSAGTNSFFSWGCIELEKDGIKRTKNARRMHMVFQVMKGAVDVTVADTSFTIHRNGVFQVPRGNQYSIRNASNGNSRVFFAQAFETNTAAED